MIGKGILIAKIRGIVIRADYSVLLIAGLLAFGLGGGVIPTILPATPPALAWLAGGIGSLLLIASLAAHEMGHALMAKRRGVKVQGIRLWMLGGVTQMDGEGMTAQNEVLIVLMGPAVTFLLTILFGAVSVLLNSLNAPALIVVVGEWLGILNLALLIFNLVPAFPLDGGQAFRGMAWLITQDHAKATRWAATLGRILGMVLITLGLFEVFFYGSAFGLWLIFIGWYLDTSSKYEVTREDLQLTMAGIKVSEVMAKEPMIVPSWITVELLIQQYFKGRPVAALATHGLDGQIDGLVWMADIKKVPAAKRNETRVSTISVPVDSVPRGRPEEMLIDLLKRIGGGMGRLALVFDGEKLVGSVSPADVAMKLQERRAAIKPAG